MFEGTIPQDTRNVLSQIAAEWGEVADVAVGCCGNFTVERVLWTVNPAFRLHSNDVSLYTGAIGGFLAGAPLRIELAPALAEEVGWLAPYLREPVDAVATVMLATNFPGSPSKDGHLRSNRYYDRLLPAWRAQWPALHAKTVERMNALPLRLASYTNGDVVPWAAGLGPEVALISYPPFWAEGYEVMWRLLDTLFSWDKPSYAPMDEARIDEYLAVITGRKRWIFGVPRRLPAWEDQLRGVTQTSNRGVPIYVYASNGPRRIVVPEQTVAPVPFAPLVPGQPLGDTLRLAPLTGPQFAGLRSKYMNPFIAPAQVSAAYAILVDNALAGAFAFSAATGVSSGSDLSTLYLLSDFAVAPTDYPRLSKLVLYAALSREARLLAERLNRRRVRWLFTTAFTNNPVSMKYRGLFDVYSRKPNPDWSEHGPAGEKRFIVNYQAEAGQWTLAEALSTWRAKHGQTGKEAPHD